MTIKLEECAKLLGVSNLQGDDEEVKLLLAWISYLVEQYGRDWVVKHRESILEQHDYILTVEFQ